MLLWLGQSLILHVDHRVRMLSQLLFQLIKNLIILVSSYLCIPYDFSEPLKPTIGGDFVM